MSTVNHLEVIWLLIPRGLKLLRELKGQKYAHSLAVAEAEEVEVIARVLGRALRAQGLSDESIHHAHCVRLEAQNLLHRAALRVA